MKKLLCILIAVAIGMGATAQQRPTVAVVLSGGGAKGVAHISALKAIEDAGIPIDIVCGTSIGSLIGALYSIGYSTDFLDSLVRAQDWTALLSDRADPSSLSLQQRREQNTYALIRGISPERKDQGGLIRGRNLMALFRKLCTGYLDSISFDSLPIRFACVATDIVTNTEVDFRSGYLTQAMRASMAIPGVFTPIRMGDSILVDGGLSNNYPADIARRMGADIIIGVSVQDAKLKPDNITGAVDVMNQLIDINCRNKFEENLKLSDVLMQVDVSGYSAASFTHSAVDTLLRRGAEEAARHRDELLILSARIQYTPDVFTNRRTSIPDSGADGTATRYRRAIPTGHISAIPIASVGFRFDSEESGALQMNIKLPIYSRLPLGLSGTLRLGRRLVAGAEVTLLPRSFTSPTLGYTYSRHDIDIYTEGLRTYNTKYRRHTVDFSPFNFKVKNFTLKAGARWDYYNYYGRLLSAGNEVPELTDDHYFAYFADADVNTEDHWYFPQHGTRLHASYAYRTDNLLGYNGGVGINDVSAHWRVNATIAQRLTLQPMIYGRIVMTDDIPPAYLNAIGSEWFGHQLEQQMPFAGIGNVEYIERHFIALQLQAQYRILKNHYLLLRLATAIHSNQLEQLFNLPDIYGAQIGYSYNTIFGPIDLRLGYSNRTDKLYLYINIGHCF